MSDYSIRKIMPHVYHLHFDSAYDLAMHFIRAQEYYESPRFHHQIFTLVDYMEWYAKEHEHGKGAFTYPKDWTGFNVPSEVLREIYKSSTNIPDFNRYDQLMSTLVSQVSYEEFQLFSKNPADWRPHSCPKFYFIGTSEENHKKEQVRDEKDTLAHELAHAQYYVNPRYREQMSLCLVEMHPEERSGARQALTEMGYHYSTIEDETQAYCATGLCKKLKEVISPRETRPFQRVFKEFMGRCAK